MKSRDAQAVADFLVNLRPEERALIFALLENAADVDAACAYADWLEENGRHEAGARVRRLAPQSGDVLVFTAQEMATADADLKRLNAVARSAAAVRKRLAAHGRDVCCVVLSEGETLEDMGEDAMRAAGWVRQERVAEAVAREREGCARLVERVFRERGRGSLANAIRNREADDPVDGDAPAVPAPVADIEEVAGLARRHGEPFGRGRTVDFDSPGRHGA